MVFGDTKGGDAKTGDSKGGDSHLGDAPGGDGVIADAKGDAGLDGGLGDTHVDAGKDSGPDVAKDSAAVDVAPDVPDVGVDVPQKDVVTVDIPGCVAKPETCNGIDDNCDGQTDETCDDGEACTVNDSCSGTQCYGDLKNCDDGSTCTADSCALGNCSHVNYTCDDNVVCTFDSCDPATGCTHVGKADACDDNNPCTDNDTCATGYCKGTAKNCDDQNLCTDDSCDPVQGCLHANNATVCDDGNPCTPSDMCTGGACVGSGGACDDGNACTDDTCDSGICGHVNNAGTCSDGDGCTTGDACNAGSCVAGTPTNCDDGLACTADACSGGTCSHADTCGANQKCDAATNACVITGCTLPANACADGGQNRKGCGNGRVIGRNTAKTAGGFTTKNQSACDSSNYFAGGGGQCFDTGYDHTYRIFLRKGEVVNINYSGFLDSCFGSGTGYTNWEIIQSSSGCGEPAGGSCGNYVKCTSKTSGNYTAPAEGWYMIIADAQDSDFSGAGPYYTLTVKLDPASCQVPGCECQ